jgi:hypothetical protein
MNDEVIHLLRAGATEGIATAFRGVVHGPRFAGTTVGVRLAPILTGAGGANRDTPIYELCHFAAMAAALGYDDSNGRFLFFLGMERVTPAAVRRFVEETVDSQGWAREGHAFTERGMRANYDQEPFEVWFDRAPVLMALFEFLTGIDDVTFFREMDDLLQEMVTPPVTLRGIKDTANRISSRMRLWRRANIAWAAHEERFDKIAPYLTENSPNGYWVIDDEVIFGFWVLHSNTEKKPIREYATVFEAFATLMRVIRAGAVAEAASDARRLGTDFEAGEIEVANDSGTVTGEWESPLGVFNHPNLKSIRFFKGEGERAPIERLMEFGPDAQRLARAFLRLESFAPTQNVISNAIRFKRGPGAISDGIACTNTLAYLSFEEILTGVLDHIGRLQLAAMHVLRAEVDEDAFAPIAEQARTAFEELRRKGFDDDDPGEDQREAFQVAADALPRIAGQLRGFLERMREMEQGESELNQIFADDVALFSRQFHAIYGHRR